MTRHYETLIQNLDVSLAQNDFSTNTATTLSLHRLAQSLRSLLLSMNGESSSPSHSPSSSASDPMHAYDPELLGYDPPDLPTRAPSSTVPTPAELDALLGAREDWAVEREAERRLRPFACAVGECTRRYKNMNGLRYHYQHCLTTPQLEPWLD